MTVTTPDIYSDPLHVANHTRQMLVEQIMALVGRASSDPQRYRQILESFDVATLRRTLDGITTELTSGPFSALQ
jgi:hypothetical protein